MLNKFLSFVQNSTQLQFKLTFGVQAAIDSSVKNVVSRHVDVEECAAAGAVELVSHPPSLHLAVDSCDLNLQFSLFEIQPYLKIAGFDGGKPDRVAPFAGVIALGNIPLLLSCGDDGLY